MSSVSDQDLQALEADVAAALRNGDRSKLTVLGFGEISVALGYPADGPTHVCKRTPPFSPAEFGRYADLVHDYVEQVRAAGLLVVDTEVRSVDRGDEQIAYVVQPLLPSESLGNKVLLAAEPDPEHPFLVALGEAILVASPSRSIDAQVTNWSWDGSALTLIDVGTPFLWDASGDLIFDMKPFLAMLPAPTRPLVKSELTKMVGRWQQPRGVAIDVVANLLREGLHDWADAMVAALNNSLGASNAFDLSEANAIYIEDLKTWPRLEKLKRVERSWRTNVRRRPYDFFIQSTYDSGSIS